MNIYIYIYIYYALYHILEGTPTIHKPWVFSPPGLALMKPKDMKDQEM